jgi:hypothetical protein
VSEYYATEIDALQTLTGLDFTIWRANHK